MLDYFGRADETGFMLVDLGNVLLLDRKTEDVKNLYRRSLKVFQRKMDFKGLAVAYNNMGIAFNRVKEFDSSLAYFNKALKIREKLKESYFILQSYVYIAQTYNSLLDAISW
jgi:tetratricopeptide (TPR) repeat protein